MQSGSAFRSNIAASAHSFRIIRGEPKKYVKTADSGTKRVHAFCPECGGPVYASAFENPQTYSLRVGALKQRDLLGVPVRQIWTKRRMGWLPHLFQIFEVDGQP